MYSNQPSQDQMRNALCNPRARVTYMYPFIPCDEEFRNVSIYMPHISNRYWISNYGRLYDAMTGYINPATYNRKGYESISIQLADGNRLTTFIHILVCTCFNGPKPGPEYQVNHIDFGRHNNYYQNLEWLTLVENVKYSVAAGNYYHGNEHVNAIYKEAEVRQVCELLQAGYSESSEISKIVFGFSNKSTCDFVRSIKIRRHWNNISKDYVFDETSYDREYIPETMKLLILQHLYEYPELANATYSQILIHMGFVVKGMNDDIRKQFKYIVANTRRPNSYKEEREKLNTLSDTPPMFTRVDPESASSLDQFV